MARIAVVGFGNTLPEKKRRGRDKVHAVMSEYKRGTLRSSSGKKVKSRDMAVAIALSEAGLSRKKK